MWLHQVAERGYHIGRQVDQLNRQVDQLHQQLHLAAAGTAGLTARLADATAAAEVQRGLLLQRVSDAFISGAQVRGGHWTCFRAGQKLCRTHAV